MVCHRRFGKTVLAVNHLIRGALTSDRLRPRFGYLAPTYTQGKATSFDYFKYYADPVPSTSVNQSELRVDFPNGGQTRIYGADNPDGLRGLYFDGVVLDEFGMHPPKTYSEVVSATLVDRGGWALFMGTPAGKNQFWEIAQFAKEREAAGDPMWFYREYPASKTGLLDAEYLAQARATMTADEYAQEFECSFEAAIKGAIYATELAAARSEGRICDITIDPALPVDTDWDLGVLDPTAIWFSQSTRGGEVRLVDYYEGSDAGFSHYAQVLREKGYNYGQHWAPHDIQVRELSGDGRSRQEVAQSFGINFQRVPRLQGSVRGEVEEGIHALKMLFPRLWIDQTRCKRGIEALMHYRRDYNSRIDEFKATVVHDWSSHASDAARGLAVRHQVPREKRKEVPVSLPMNWGWS